MTLTDKKKYLLREIRTHAPILETFCWTEWDINVDKNDNKKIVRRKMFPFIVSNFNIFRGQVWFKILNLGQGNVGHKDFFYTLYI